MSDLSQVTRSRRPKRCNCARTWCGKQSVQRHKSSSLHGHFGCTGRLVVGLSCLRHLACLERLIRRQSGWPRCGVGFERNRVGELVQLEDFATGCEHNSGGHDGSAEPCSSFCSSSAVPKPFSGGYQGARDYFEKNSKMSISQQLRLHPCNRLPTLRTRAVHA